MKLILNSNVNETLSVGTMVSLGSETEVKYEVDISGLEPLLISVMKDYLPIIEPPEMSDEIWEINYYQVFIYLASIVAWLKDKNPQDVEISQLYDALQSLCPEKFIPYSMEPGQKQRFIKITNNRSGKFSREDIALKEKVLSLAGETNRLVVDIGGPSFNANMKFVDFRQLSLNIDLYVRFLVVSQALSDDLQSQFERYSEPADGYANKQMVKYPVDVRSDGPNLPFRKESVGVFFSRALPPVTYAHCLTTNSFPVPLEPNGLYVIEDPPARLPDPTNGLSVVGRSERLAVFQKPV